VLAGRAARGALVFTYKGRGRQLFDTPDHDASVVADPLGTSALAGMFCAGELGPVGGRNAMRGFTASIAISRRHSSRHQRLHGPDHAASATPVRPRLIGPDRTEPRDRTPGSPESDRAPIGT
jgi:hypothetical protein